MRGEVPSWLALAPILLLSASVTCQIPLWFPPATAQQGSEPIVINSPTTVTGDFVVNSTDTVIVENATLRVRYGRVKVYGLLQVTNGTVFVDSFESWRTHNGLEIYDRGALRTDKATLLTSINIRENGIADMTHTQGLNIIASDAGILRWAEGQSNGSITLEDLSLAVVTSVTVQENIVARTDARLDLTNTSCASMILQDENVANLMSVSSVTLTMDDASRVTASDSHFDRVLLMDTSYADFHESSIRNLGFFNNSVVWVNNSTVGSAVGGDFALFVPVNSQVGSVTYIRTRSNLATGIIFASFAGTAVLRRLRNIKRLKTQAAQGDTSDLHSRCRRLLRRRRERQDTRPPWPK